MTKYLGIDYLGDVDPTKHLECIRILLSRLNEVELANCVLRTTRWYDVGNHFGATFVNRTLLTYECESF